MQEEFTTVRIRKSTLERVRKWAEQGCRSVPMQLDLMADAFSSKQYQVISISDLPHPPNAQSVPLILVQES